MNVKIIVFILAICFTFTILGSCGQSGDLYLPDEYSYNLK
ncbi:MAG: lipoprotein [Pseudomonadota bacterium]|nr:lipoprotein [Pseudomonadota bacterium]